MNEKFTKGNWEAQKHGDDDSPFFDVVFGDAQNGQIIILDIEGHTDEEAEANAYLIAAAPELFEACKAAYGAFGFPIDDESFTKVTNLLANALRKAKGTPF